jgi:metal-responsive CopG/Arc/MetJ family transcriptional regulator
MMSISDIKNLVAMRTIIDIPDDQVAKINRLAKEAGQSRAALIREALEKLIASRQQEPDLDVYFGLWTSGQEEDGLAYQERLRAEWPD